MKLSTAHMRLRLNIAAMNHDGLRGRRGLEGSAPSRLLLWERGQGGKLQGIYSSKPPHKGFGGLPGRSSAPRCQGWSFSVQKYLATSQMGTWRLPRRLRSPEQPLKAVQIAPAAAPRASGAQTCHNFRRNRAKRGFSGWRDTVR